MNGKPLRRAGAKSWAWAIIVLGIGFVGSTSGRMADLGVVPIADEVRVLQDLLATPADGVSIIATSMDTAMLCQQIRKLDKNSLIIASEWAATERLIELGGKAVEGVVMVQPFDRTSTAPRYLVGHLLCLPPLMSGSE